MTHKERRQINHFFATRFQWHKQHPIEHDLCDSCQAVVDGDPDGANYYCFCSDIPPELEAFEGTVSDFNRASLHISGDEFFAVANDRAHVLLPAFEVLYKGEDRQSWIVSWQPSTEERLPSARLQRPGLASTLGRLVQGLLCWSHREGALGDFAEDFADHCQKWGAPLAHLWLVWQIVISIPPLMQVRLERLWKR